MKMEKRCVVCGGKLTDAHGNVCGRCWDRMKDKTKPKTNIEKLLLEIERLKGKMEIFESFRPQINERISGLSEEIGDIRRMVLDVEKNQTELISGFERVKDLVESIEPERLLKNLEGISNRLEILSAKVEKNEKLFGNINEEVKKNREMMSKVKGLENLVEISEKIEEKVNKIKSTEAYTERLAAKVENIFSDLNEKLLVMKEKLGIVDKLDALSKDLLKEIDKVNLRFEEQVITKQDLERLKSILEGEIESIKNKPFLEGKEKKVVERRIKELTESVKSIEKEILANRIAIEGLEKKVEGIIQQTKSLEELEVEREKIINLLERAERDYKAGTLSLKTYQDVTRANRNRLKIIESILERVSREAFYRKLRLMEDRLSKVLDNLDSCVKRNMLDEIINNIARINEKVDELENIKENFAPIKESSNILSDRISTLEERLDAIKERRRKLTSLESKLEDFERRLKMMESILQKQEKREERKREEIDELRERIDEVLAKVFSLEKNDDEMLHLISKLTPSDYKEIVEKVSKIEKMLEGIRKTKADVKDVSQLRASFESVINKNTEIIEKILKELGV